MGINLVDQIQDIVVRRSLEGSENFRPFEDFSDRLNRIFTSAIITILATITMANIYFVRSIACITPNYDLDVSEMEFVEAVCWMQGVLGIKPNQVKANQTEWIEVQHNSRMLFFPWIPFLLMVQALLFYLPSFIWHDLLSNTLGDHFASIVTRARQAKASIDRDQHNRFITACAEYLFMLSRQHADNRSTLRAQVQRKIVSMVPFVQICVFGKRLGNRTAVCYLLIKLLYIINASLQFWLIMRCLGPNVNGNSDAFQFTRKLFAVLLGLRTEDGGNLFPLQTVCPVNVTTGNQNQTFFLAVCALPVNLLNEKIFLFLWAWVLVVIIISVISFFLWNIRLLPLKIREKFIANFLRNSYVALWPMKNPDSTLDRRSEIPKANEENMRKFVKEIGVDGSFAIRMLKINAGDVVTGEILMEWWKLFIRINSAEDANDPV